MAFHHDNDGVGAGSDTFQLEFIQALSPGNKFQVFRVDYIDTGRLQTLLIFVILHCKKEEILILRPKLIHQSDLDKTTANHSLHHIPTEIHCSFVDRSDFYFFVFLEIAGTAAF